MKKENDDNIIVNSIMTGVKRYGCLLKKYL